MTPLILVLEDDPDLSLLLERSLEAAGYAVSLHLNTTSALEFFETTDQEVACVVADIFVMENGVFTQDGGIRLISTLKQLKRVSIPVIAISGSFARKDRLHIEETVKTVGADRLLAKPFRPRELIELIESVLNK